MPQLAVILGVMYALASTAVLIYFIHHIPASIHASFVISAIGKQLIDQTTRLYSEERENGEATNSGTLVSELPRDSHTFDSGGALRIIAPVLSSHDFILETLRRITPYSASDRNSALHMQATIARLMINICNSVLLPSLLDQARSLKLYAEQHLVDADIALLQARNVALAEISPDPAANVELSIHHAWLRGGA